MNRTLLAIFLLLLFLFVLNAASSSVRGFVFQFTAPLQSVLWERGRTLVSPGAQEELRRKEIAAKEQGLGELAELRRENIDLRRAVGLAEQEAFELIGLEVIGKAPGEESVLARLGQPRVVARGAPVITAERVAVGQVDEVFGMMVRVRLLSHPDSSIDAKIAATGAAGIIRGQGGGTMLVDLLPQEYELQAGASVITSPLGEIFPEGLLVGNVWDVQRSDVDPFQRAAVLPVFSARRLDLLFVITNFPP